MNTIIYSNIQIKITDVDSLYFIIADYKGYDIYLEIFYNLQTQNPNDEDYYEMAFKIYKGKQKIISYLGLSPDVISEFTRYVNMINRGENIEIKTIDKQYICPICMGTGVYEQLDESCVGFSRMGKCDFCKGKGFLDKKPKCKTTTKMHWHMW